MILFTITLTSFQSLLPFCRIDKTMHGFDKFDFPTYGPPSLFWGCLIMSNFTEKLQFQSYALPFLFYMIHRCTVALKYASLNENEYEKMRLCKDSNKVSRYQSQMQILTSWWTFQPEMLDFNIISAAAICGADIENTFFILPSKDDTFESPDILYKYFNQNEAETRCIESPYDAWRLYLESAGIDFNNLPKNEMGHLLLSVHDFCRAILSMVKYFFFCWSMFI